MPLFSYIATNDDNKEVRGSIESPDLINARKALEDLNLDIIQLGESSRSHHQSAAPMSQDEKQPTFAFEGKDISGSIRRGTMQAISKYEAFKKLRDDQKLFLTMLSPSGVLPQYKDPELDQWQRGVKEGNSSMQPKAVPESGQTPKLVTKPSIGFTNIPEVSKKADIVPAVTTSSARGAYHSLTATLRLYGGWLLAWYGLFVAIGYYSAHRELTWDIPFVQAFYLSPLIFHFIVAIFIFLLLSVIHKTLRGGLILATVFFLLGIGILMSIKILA